jgi:hypothetical protein
MNDLPASSLGAAKAVLVVVYSCLANLGFLVLPFAVGMTSLYSLIPLLLVPLVASYTSVCLSNSIDQAHKTILGYGSISSYPLLAYHTGGAALMAAVQGLLALESLGVSTLFFIVEITSFKYLMGSASASPDKSGQDWEIYFAIGFVVLFTSLVELPFYFRLGLLSSFLALMVLVSEVIEYNAMDVVVLDDQYSYWSYLPVTTAVFLFNFNIQRAVPQLKVRWT